MQEIASAADLRIGQVPLRRVPFESKQITDIHAMRDRILNRFGERRNIRLAEVQALTSEGVNDVCGVADERNARRDVLRGVSEAQREGSDCSCLHTCCWGRDLGWEGGVLDAPGEFVLVGWGGIGGGGLHAHHVGEVCHVETEGGVDHGEEGRGWERL